jgi:hypothetical protein
MLEIQEKLCPFFNDVCKRENVYDVETTGR